VDKANLRGAASGREHAASKGVRCHGEPLLVKRIWRQESLKVPAKQPKRQRLWLGDGSCIPLGPTHRNRVWSDDFVVDRMADGRELRMLTIVAEFTWVCLAIDLSRKLTSEDVLERLSDLFVRKGVPDNIRSDNGSDFTATRLREWLGRIGVKTLYVLPGSPWENGSGCVTHAILVHAVPRRSGAALWPQPSEALQRLTSAQFRDYHKGGGFLTCRRCKEGNQMKKILTAAILGFAGVMLVSGILMAQEEKTGVKTVTKWLANWCTVVTPESAKIGDTVEVKVTLKDVMVPTKLSCHLHFLKADGKLGGLWADAPPTDVTDDGTYSFEFKLIEKDDAAKANVVIFLSPDGDWKSKTANCGGAPFPVSK